MCPSRVTVNAASRKEVAYRFTAEDGVAKPKLEIEYEGEVEEKPDVKLEVNGEDSVEGLEGVKTEAEATVDTISVKPEPL